MSNNVDSKTETTDDLSREVELLRALVLAKKIGPPEKDFWDKCSAIGGILIAVIGGIFTILYNSYSSKASEDQAARDFHLRELSAYTQLIPYLAKKDDLSQKFAIIGLDEFGNPKLARLAALANPTAGTLSAIIFLDERKKGQQRGVTSESQPLRNSVRIFSNDLVARDQVVSALTMAGFAVIANPLPQGPHPNRTDVRYYHHEDIQAANDIAKMLSVVKLPLPVIDRTNDPQAVKNHPSGTIEVWFDPKPS